MRDDDGGGGDISVTDFCIYPFTYISANQCVWMYFGLQCAFARA